MACQILRKILILTNLIFQKLKVNCPTEFFGEGSHRLQSALDVFPTLLLSCGFCFRIKSNCTNRYINFINQMHKHTIGNMTFCTLKLIIDVFSWVECFPSQRSHQYFISQPCIFFLQSSNSVQRLCTCAVIRYNTQIRDISHLL